MPNAAQSTFQPELAHTDLNQFLVREAGDALGLSEARFQAIYDHAGIGIGILGLDRRVLEANPAMCRMLGLTREELIGQPSLSVTHADDWTESTRVFEALRAGECDACDSERRYLRKNGEVFWAQVTMSGVRGPDGQLRFLVGMVIDIDAQRRTQQLLRESEARFRAMFDHAPVGVSLLTLDRRILQVNPSAAKITGYTVEELKALDPT